nr:hypothetical protein [Tanacetum cinerariifolium]
MNQNFYNFNSPGFDQPQPPQSSVIHQPPQEISIHEMDDLKQQYLDDMKHLINSKYHDEIKIAELKQNFNGMSIEINKKEKLQKLEQWANLSTYPSKRFNSFCYDDDDEEYTITVTPSLSTEEPDKSLSMGDEHLDTILAIESDEFITSSVENLIPILSESEGIPDNMHHLPIDNDILLTIKDDILREKLLNVNLFIAKIEALNDNPTPSSDFMTKSSSTSLNSLLEETNTFDNSLTEFETFCFDVEEINSGSTTTRSDISLPEYEAFYDDHVKEISSGNTTSHSASSLYDSFIFDLLINPFPLADRSDFYEFADELMHIISPPEYDCFLFKIEPNSRDFTIEPNEPDNSLSMGDEYLDTIPVTESDEFIKSSVENLVPIPSESEGESECGVPARKEFTTFSNVLFDAEYESDSRDNQSFSDEDVPEKIFSNPLFEEEIIPTKTDHHYYNAESDLTASLHICLIEKLLYDNSSSRPPKEFISANFDTETESFFPSPIRVEDSDSLMEEIDLSFTPDYLMPPGIKDDDYDSERDILILKDLPSNDTLSIPKIESFHFDIPSFSRPPAKPPDGNT